MKKAEDSKRLCENQGGKNGEFGNEIPEKLGEISPETWETLFTLLENLEKYNIHVHEIFNCARHQLI